MNRRKFLTSVGGGATALALSRSLDGLAQAAAAGPVKRLIVFFTSSGCAANYFWPDTPGTGFDLKVSLAPLAAYQSKMTVIRGLSIGPGSNHGFGMENCLTVGADNSFEQVLADSIGADLLNLSVAPLAGGQEMSFRKKMRIPGIYDPFQSRAEVVRTVNPSAVGGMQGANIAAIRQFKSLALGLSQKELDTLSKQVSGLPYESAKIKSHIEAVQEVKASLAQNPGMGSAPQLSCSMLSTLALDKTKGLTTSGDAVQPNLPALLDAQIENVIQAFACGQRTMANLQVMHAWGNHVFSWLGFSGAHHQQLSHWVPSEPNGKTAQDFATCHNWLSTRFLTLVQGLDVPDPLSPGKTILDNTCILWTSEVDGGDAHSVQSIPVVLMGNLGGTIKSGQFVSYGPPGGIAGIDANNNRNMGDLFATLSNLMGAPMTTSYGPRQGRGLVEEIFGVSALGRWSGGLTLLALTLAACSSGSPGKSSDAPAGAAGAAGATSGGAPTAAGNAGAAGAVTAPIATCANGESGKPAFRMLRRLSEAEYNNTLVDALGADAKSWQKIQLVGDIRQSGNYSTYSAALTVNQPWLSALVDSTFERAQALFSGPQAASVLVAPCAAMAIDAACATAVVRSAGYRLFRRPITDAEVTDYVGLFNQGIATLQLSPSDALAGTLAALMQSPNTLYIQELGQPAGNAFKLSGYELASVLAYGLTGTAPSKALLDSVGAGALDAPEGIATATQALIKSPQGQAHMSTFFLQWLSYDGAPYAAKDPAVYTLPNPVATAMVKETQQFVDSTYQSGGSLADLLTSTNTFVNLSLASFYGWPTAGLTDAEFKLQQRPAGQGIGLLAQGGLLARLGTPNSASPTQRGLFVLRQLVCGDVPPPPADIPVIPVPSGNVTTRERYEAQHAVGSCGACHTHLDQIGFGLENFDGVGKYRTMEAGKPINATGYVEDLNHLSFDGPEDLAKKLAAAPEVNRCLAAQLTAYVLGVSAHDGVCIAPATAYTPSAGATPLSLANVLSQVMDPSHLQLRVTPQ